MKYLEYSPFEELNVLLNSENQGDFRLLGRIEAYSCKPIGTDKKLYKQLENRFHEDFEQTCWDHMIVSPVGPLNELTSRKTLYFLIGTLNSSFPDYDFSNVRVEYFIRQPSLEFVCASVNAIFFNLSDTGASRSERIWEEIDKEIELKECEIYTFLPDPDADPFSENGSIWSFNYFFFNKKLKRLVLFYCTASSLVKSNDQGSEDSSNYPMSEASGQNSEGWHMEEKISHLDL